MFTIYMLIVHTLGDFVFQTDQLVEDKENLKIRAYLKHGAILLLLSIIPMFLLVKVRNYVAVLFLVGVIVVSHIVIDFLKELIQSIVRKKGKDTSKKIPIILFTLDQAIHISIILVLSRFVIFELNEFGEYIKEWCFINAIYPDYIFVVLFMVLYISISGAYFVPHALTAIYAKIPNYNEDLNAILKINMDEKEHPFIDEVKVGKYIGILERILIVIMLLTNQIAAIGFIIAAKSLARFKMMENKIFAEYYLLGTMLSIAYTFGLFYLFRTLLF